jgi:hypothetical protein
MWDPVNIQLWRDFETFRSLVALRHQTPTREWPLVYVAEYETLLVLREWPDGSVTAYAVDTSPPR